MKIEKISDNQIRCTLNRSDLQSRELKISELAYGTEKAKDLFHDMIEQASQQFGFVADDLPLMIEAIPVSSDCIILNITKVEDPEELDTRFSKFAPSSEEADEDFDYANQDDIYPSEPVIKDSDFELLEKYLGKSDKFLSMKETLESIQAEQNKKKETTTDTPVVEEEKLPKVPVPRLFSFVSLDEAATASHGIVGKFTGESVLYKNDKNERYYLLLTDVIEDNPDFLKVCNEITEYGKKENITFSTIAYLEERCKVIIPNDALNILKRI